MDAQEIKDRTDMRAFVMDDLGVYKQIYGDGALLFLCPFHTERTPSFAVYPDHATCFGACGFKGDIFSYVQQRTGKTFKEALTMLSGEYEMPRYERKPALQEKLRSQRAESPTTSSNRT
jgi:DNA primase